MARRKKWRVYQLLVAAGLVKSKDEAVEYARTGRITVNGNIMQSLHYQVHPFKDDVRFDGKQIQLKENRRYFILNKPSGIETTKQNMRKFLENVEDIDSYAPVGRLDKDTTGLLILTNDGRLAKRVLDPRTKRVKIYEATITGELNSEDVERLRKGVQIPVEEDEKTIMYTTLPAEVKINATTIEIGIVEGKKRQVKKMIQAIGHKVTSLKRTRIAKLKLEEIPIGKVKEYSKQEIYKLLFE